MKVNNKPDGKTEHMGGVPIPSTDVLKAMHRGQYILRARRGELTRVPVEKILLPHSNNMSPQNVQVDLGPDGTILTIAGSSQAGNDWAAVKDNTDLYAIRWKPVKPSR